MDKLPTILIVEDEVAIAEDLADIVSMHGYKVVGIAHSYNTAVDMLLTRQPDLVLLDISLNGIGTGIDVAHAINKRHHIPFVFITSYSDDATLESALDTKPNGYIVKPYKEEDINPIIKVAILMGSNSPESILPSHQSLNEHLENGLSNQEYIVLEHIWKGKKNTEIADDLYVSINTIKTHVQRIYNKLNVSSRVNLLKKVMLLINN